MATKVNWKIVWNHYLKYIKQAQTEKTNKQKKTLEIKFKSVCNHKIKSNLIKKTFTL